MTSGTIIPPYFQSAFVAMGDISERLAREMFWLRPGLAVLFLATTLLYHLFPNRTWQNLLLVCLGGSICWIISPVFFLILFASNLLEWGLASGIHAARSDRLRSALFWVSIGSNACLFLLDVTNRFESLPPERIGLPHHPVPACLGEPIQIVWAYFFAWILMRKATLSIDAYRGKLMTRPRFLDSMAFLSLVSWYTGSPNDRARETLPQLAQVRRWDWSDAREAFWLMAPAVLKVSFARPMYLAFYQLCGPESSGLAIVLGAWLLPLAIWLDFSGRVDLLRAMMGLLGIRIPANFDVPYISVNIAEFWRRWNITAMNWFNEEIFAKLNFALRHWMNYGLGIACLTTFIFSGIAHGVSASVVLWGVLQGFYMFIYLLNRNRIRKFAKSHGNPRWIVGASWFLTSCLTTYTWCFIYHNSLRTTLSVAKRVFTGPIWPALDGSVDWFRILAISGVTLVLHYAPHYRGGELWMKDLRRWPRFAMVCGLFALMFALN